MTPELLASAAGACVGSAAAVWAVFRIMIVSLRADVNEIRVSVRDAHKRMDRHIEANNHG